jgi:hypothetical protein
VFGIDGAQTALENAATVDVYLIGIRREHHVNPSLDALVTEDVDVNRLCSA